MIKAGDLIYKVMRLEHLESSIREGYLYFHRVDSYNGENADSSDGEQPILDVQFNRDIKFAQDRDFSLYDYYSRARNRSYAFCSSTKNSDFIWKNYGNDSLNGKVCLEFDGVKLINKLKENFNLNITSFPINLWFFMNYGLVQYVDRKLYNPTKFNPPNNVEYLFAKDEEKYKEENEFRVTISCLGVDEIENFLFESGLKTEFNFIDAINSNIITKIIYEHYNEYLLLNNFLTKNNINPRDILFAR